ncbi:hypothetical protein ACGFOM_38120 [Streptomyces sp. NPDC048594]|uniref:hypothetical protein n=1 Tax=Streptomyces sp. NPDC048594 TaxID=3365575 RepID=UPI0037190011
MSRISARAAATASGTAAACGLEVDQALFGERHVVVRALQRAVGVAAEVVAEGGGQTVGHVLVDVAAGRAQRCHVPERRQAGAAVGGGVRRPLDTVAAARESPGGELTPRGGVPPRDLHETA